MRKGVAHEFTLMRIFFFLFIFFT